MMLCEPGNSRTTCLIDYFALALTHALIVIALLRIVARPDLDREQWDFTAEEPDPAPPAQTGREAKRARRQRRDGGAGDA